ncbi:hypothetical protein LIER_22860 [Lithospermum erythrorhizon]|uniref:Nucleolar protein 12 n=1 Tax=Lithospermum erythrorhizon TaxID=34254 RepID=A0AAV3QWM1_LITER
MVFMINVCLNWDLVKIVRDYVTGFHKRKKKRRKEANIQIQEADRRKRIELRKKTLNLSHLSKETYVRPSSDHEHDFSFSVVEEQSSRMYILERKLDREFVLYGGAPPPDLDASQGETVEEQEDYEESEPVASFSGTTMYESGDVQVTVTTSEISHEEENPPTMSLPVKPPAVEGVDQKKLKVPVIEKKQLKKVSKKKPQKRTQSKRDKRKGKIQSKKR